MCTFLLSFADSFCFVFTSTHFYEASPLCTILCNLFPWLWWYVEVFKGGFEGVLVSLLLTTMGAFSYLKFSLERIFFGKRSSGILVTWPVHLNCANFRRVCMHPCPFQDFCVWNPVLPLDLKKFSKTACTEVIQSFVMPLVNCPSFACVK